MTILYVQKYSVLSVVSADFQHPSYLDCFKCITHFLPSFFCFLKERLSVWIYPCSPQHHPLISIFHSFSPKQQVCHSLSSVTEECRSIPDLGPSHSSQDPFWGAVVFISRFISCSVYPALLGFSQSWESYLIFLLYFVVQLCIHHVLQSWNNL